MFTLYGHPMSNHSNRVQMLCEELGNNYNFQLVDFETGENKSEKYLTMNPNGQVPMIDDDGYIVWESHAIMRYLSEKTNSETWYPKELKARIEVEKWLDWSHTRLNPEAVSLAFNMFILGENADQQKIEECKEKIKNLLPILDKQLSNNKYVCGQQITIADLSIHSSMVYLESCNIDFSEYKCVVGWYSNIKDRPSFEKVAPKVA